MKRTIEMCINDSRPSKAIGSCLSVEFFLYALTDKPEIRYDERARCIGPLIVIDETPQFKS